LGHGVGDRIFGSDPVAQNALFYLFNFVVKTLLLDHYRRFCAILLDINHLRDEVREELVLDVSRVIAEKLGVELLVGRRLALGLEEAQVELKLAWLAVWHDLD
jgi:hypothetical protein